MMLAVPCVRCHVVHHIEADAQAIVAWQNGAMIQDALPDMSDSIREMLVSGVCPECWEIIFKEEE